MIILGIESSCDETAVAIVKDKKEVLSSIVASQIDVHKEFGGVVPEVASRIHVENISYCIEQALTQANVTMDMWMHSSNERARIDRLPSCRSAGCKDFSVCLS